MILKDATAPLAVVILNNIILTLPTKKILSDQSSRNADPMYAERRQSLWGETLLNTVPSMRPGDAHNATAPPAAGRMKDIKCKQIFVKQRTAPSTLLDDT